MLPKLKFHQDWCHQNKKVTKIELSPKLKCHQNWNITKTEMSPKIKFHQKLMVTKTRISSKLKCHQNWNVTKTEMLPNIIIMSSKSKSKSKRSALITLVLFLSVVARVAGAIPELYLIMCHIQVKQAGQSVDIWHAN